MPGLVTEHLLIIDHCRRLALQLLQKQLLQFVQITFALVQATEEALQVDVVLHLLMVEVRLAVPLGGWHRAQQTLLLHAWLLLLLLLCDASHHRRHGLRCHSLSLLSLRHHLGHWCSLIVSLVIIIDALVVLRHWLLVLLLIWHH